MSQIAIDRHIWSYVEIGERAGLHRSIPILILHGWGRSGSEWINMAKELSKWSGRKVYVPDLPGFGGSGLPKVKNIFEYSNLVVEFCKYMDLKKVIIVGHSLGGRIGIVMGARYREMVEKVILIDPAGVRPRSIRRVILQLLAGLFRWVPVGLRRNIMQSAMDEDYRNSPALHDLYRAIVRHDLRNELRNIKCMVDLVWGERDRILPLSLTRIYRRHLPHSRLRVVWGADHDPHLTKYEQTLSILQETVE